MRKIIILVIATVFTLFSCKNEKEKNESKSIDKQKVSYLSFGDKINSKQTLSKIEMAEKYKNLKEGDTLTLKFTSSINEVCKKKGCWMKLDLGADNEVMVRFKDYGFFMPLNADGREVIVNGKAYVSTTSVEELRHFAKDAGKTEEEILKITDPEYTLAFEADGVLMKE
ncbi:hypothetical protein MNBD_BACTEROID04-1442 [hydrothermal vent metagenome]|uniref:Branched-chain amino acid aminotransferase n=1 Tax=hydrothermal vent metagenome TaxID=652676 RepID=A0A3B0U575_9ZZZZ